MAQTGDRAVPDVSPASPGVAPPRRRTLLREQVHAGAFRPSRDPSTGSPALPLFWLAERLALAAQTLQPSGLVVGLRRVWWRPWSGSEGPLDLRVSVASPAIPPAASPRRSAVALLVTARVAGAGGPRTVAGGEVLLGARYPRRGAVLPPLRETGAAAQTVEPLPGTPSGMLRRARITAAGASALLDAGAGDAAGIFPSALLGAWLPCATPEALQRWFPGAVRPVPHLPVRLHWVTFHGPSPRQGEVRCELRAAGISAPKALPALRLQLRRGERIWAELRLSLAPYPAA